MIPRRCPIKSWHSFIPPIILAVSLLGIYLGTIAPGLTWANGGSDVGDLITAAATGGIAHPTGYPLYLLLARLFQFLPFGSLAFRTNLMSAVFTVLASVLIYDAVTRHLVASRAIPRTLVGLAAGYCFGLAPLIWSQAVITEVYALQAFLVISVIALYARPEPASDSQIRALDGWRGLVLGLATGNHVTTLLLVPMALLLGSFHRQIPFDLLQKSRKYIAQGGILAAGDSGGSTYARGPFSDHGEPWLGNYKFDLSSLGRQLLGFGAGLSIYLTLPLRALTNPPVNWGNPVSLDRLWWLVSGKLYQGVYLQFDLSHLWVQILFWMEFAVKQLGIPVILLGLLGLIVFGNFSRLVLITLWGAATCLVFVSVYRSADADVYLIPLLLSFAIWLGLGAGSLIEQLSQRSYALGMGVGILLIGYILVRPISYIQQVDASQDQRADVFGQEVLFTVPENAIVFARGDKAIFALWYYHFALHERPDLTILATDLLHYDWYQEVLQSTYPSLSVPVPFPYPETIMRANPERPVCRVEYTDHAEIECTEP